MSLVLRNLPVQRINHLWPAFKNLKESALGKQEHARDAEAFIRGAGFFQDSGEFFPGKFPGRNACIYDMLEGGHFLYFT